MARVSNAKIQVVLLGTGTPNAEPERSGAALAIVADEVAYLVDCGPGIVRRISAARERGVTGLAPAGLSRLFITHLHSDHTAGFADLMLTPWVLGRREPLRVFGPRGLRAMAEHLLGDYAEDVRERLEGLEPANETGWRVEATEIDAGRVYSDERLAVDAFRVNHGSWPAYGYRFTSADRTIVVSGDTAPFPDWETAYSNCDVLVHEVQSANGLAGRDAAWRAYHESVHTTTHQLARVASRARPRRLVLTHILLHGESERRLLEEIHEGYDGEVVLGRDLDVF